MRDVRRVGDRRELGQPHAVRCPVPRPAGDLGRDLGRQPRLPRATRADQGDEPVAVQGRTDPGDLMFAADEAGERDPQVSPRAAGRSGAIAGRRPGGRWRRPGRRDFPAQGLKVRGLHLGAGIDAELIGQPGPQRLMRRKRVRLPPGSGQRAHQQRGELLVERVPGDERLEFRDVRGGPARVNLTRDVRDEGVQAQPVQARGVRRGEVADVGEGRAAP